MMSSDENHRQEKNVPLDNNLCYVFHILVLVVIECKNIKLIVTSKKKNPINTVNSRSNICPKFICSDKN